MQLKISPRVYSWVWTPAYAVGIGLAGWAIFDTIRETGKFMLPFYLMLCGFIIASLRQFVLYFVFGNYFTRGVYFGNRMFFTVFAVATMFIWFVALLLSGTGQDKMKWGGICAFYQCTLCVVEGWLVGAVEFRGYMIGNMTLTCLGYLAYGSSKPRDTAHKKLWPRLKMLLRRSRAGPIALPVDDAPSLELEAARPHMRGAWSAPTGFTESINDWLPTNKSLWITVDDPESRKNLADAAYNIFKSDSAPRFRVASIDMSSTISPRFHLVHGLASASTEFRQELETTTPEIISDLFVLFPLYSIYRRIRGASDIERPDTPLKDFVEECITKPLIRLYEQRYLGPTTPVKPEVILVLHGIKNTTHAREIFDAIRHLQLELKDHSRALRIVAITEPALFRNVADQRAAALKCLEVMHIVEPSFIIFSGTSTPRAPYLSESVFLVLVEAVYRLGGVDAQKRWPEVEQISRNGLQKDDDADRTTLNIFAQLHRVAEDRERIQMILSSMPMVARSRVFQSLVKDNAKVAELLQELFMLGNYREEIKVVPKEYSSAVLNLIHSILDGGGVFKDNAKLFKAFSKQARRILSALVGHLGLLPDALEISNVRLEGDHPVNRGGFAMIYRGHYKSTTESGTQKQIQVALKVIPIFGHLSDEEKRRTLEKFSKEALVWRYLKHPNVVPFMGIDSTTFESPQRALVSPWMKQGSVLDFIAKNSPAAQHALELCHDIIEGLRYLHSQNVIHGDLCARNILINDDGRACLSDFGLAAFVEADTSAKTSSRSGSRQWMSPELLNPPPDTRFRRTIPADVWAFACVCCEIWTEGTVPYNHLGKGDPGIFFALGNAVQHPYIHQPLDKAGSSMPDDLWELCQSCWKVEPAERPAVQIIVDKLSEMRPLEDIDTQADDQPRIPSRSKGKRRVDATPNSSSTQPIAVRFGPLPAFDYANPEDIFTTDPEDIFTTDIFEGLLQRAKVPRDALAAPSAVYASKEEPDCLYLHFRSLMEANGFVMTWELHRFQPYLECSASIVDR